MPIPFAFTILARNPDLWALLAAARACPPGDWARFEAEVKAPLRARVGWYAPDDAPAALRTSEAYDEIYAVLLAAFEAPARRQAA